MFEKLAINHYIQKHIIEVLMYRETARFRDLRPAKVDTNLFAYHLKGLVKMGAIVKSDQAYTLSASGLAYVDRVSVEKKVIRTQPKIITMLVIQNENGDVLLQYRTKQPFIDSWTLPYGKLHVEDASVKSAAQREAFEKLGLESPELEHAGDAYIRVIIKGELLSSTLVHVFRANLEYDETARKDLQWVRPHKLKDYSLSPAVEEIMTRTFFRDPFYFEEFTVEW